MQLRLLFSLTVTSGSFSISVDGVPIAPDQWEDGGVNCITHTRSCEPGQRLHMRLYLSGRPGDHLSMRVSLEDWGVELGTFPLTIENGHEAEDSLIITVPEPAFRMDREAWFPKDEAGPEIRDGAPLSGSMMQKEAPAVPLPQPGLPRVIPAAIHLDLDSGNYEVEVFYATDRNAIKTGAKLSFGQERGSLQYGKCLVSIPQNKALGELPRPVWWKLQFSEDPDKHVMVLDTVAWEKDAYYAELRETVQRATEHDAFIFIHGYNVSFEEAAWRTAQIAYDTGFGGAPLMYSWPSRASLEGYFSDEDNVQYSHHSIVQFIRDVKERSGARRLHLIAHSMGNRALTGALLSLQESGYFRDTRFNQVILAAPDIDAQIFINDIAPNLADCSARVTLYASSKDKALMASRRLRENMRRAGDGGAAIVCCPGIDTIDASEVDTDLLGHGYFAATQPLIRDISSLLHTDQGPGERKLRAVVDSSKSYWRI